MTSPPPVEPSSGRPARERSDHDRRDRLDPSTTALVGAARDGDARAWAMLVGRYERLVFSVARGFRFDDDTTADVVQTTWLRLAEHLGRIRDPEGLASWLATTCRNEAIATLRRRQREFAGEDTVLDVGDEAIATTDGQVDDRLLADEAAAEVLRSFRALSEPCQEMLRLLCADPPPDYRTISELTGRPIGSIGPTRARCLSKLRDLVEHDRTQGAVDRV